MSRRHQQHQVQKRVLNQGVQTLTKPAPRHPGLGQDTSQVLGKTHQANRPTAVHSGALLVSSP